MNQILGRVSLYYNNIFIGSEFECNIGREVEILSHNINGIETAVQKRIIDQTVSLHSILKEENEMFETIIKLKVYDNNFCEIRELVHNIVLQFKGITLIKDNPFAFKYKTLENSKEYKV